MLRFQNHRIFSFHSFRAGFGTLPDRKLGELADNMESPDGSEPDYERIAPRPAGCWLPPRLIAAGKGRYADMALFKPATVAPGSDLLLPLKNLLSGEQTERCRIYRLTPDAMKLLNAGRLYDKEVKPEERFGHRLAAVPVSSAERRLCEAVNGSSLPNGCFFETAGKDKKRLALPLALTDMLVYHFASGHLICQNEFEIELPEEAPVTQDVLAEAVDHFGRFATLAWIETSPSILTGKDAEAAQKLLEIDGFTAGTLAARLTCGSEARTQSSLRSYTHAFAVTDPDGTQTDAAELLRVATGLARQYTSDYSIRTDVLGFDAVSDFENVIHVVAREGAATLIDPRTNGKVVPFLQDYLAMALKPSYLPLLVLNLYQLGQALEITARSVLETHGPEAIRSAGKEYETNGQELEEIVGAWHRLQDDLAVLKSRFRFLHVSQVTMHNEFNDTLRACFGLDKLESRLSADLSEMSARVQAATSLLEQQRRKQFRTRYRWIPILVSGALTAVALFEIASAISAFMQDGKLQLFEVLTVVAILIASLSAMVWIDTKDRYGPDDE